MKDLEIKVRGVIEPVVSSLGIAVDYIELTKMGGKFLLRVFIEKEGGVTLDDCELVSREVEAVLDVEDPIPSAYVLEVSSPGLDRPLRNPADFRKFSGRTARIVTYAPVENQTFFIGEIAAVEDDNVVLVLPGDEKITIPYKNISRARLEVKI